MQARIANPMMLLPEATQALIALHASTKHDGVPVEVYDLVHLRASQINGCSVCIAMHAKNSSDESIERLLTVAAWRDAPYFTDAERAALALTEAVTRLSDRPDPVPDEVWNEAVRHFDEQALAALILNIATVNVFNRFNVATRQVAGEWKG